jgi:DinB superfamily
VDTPQLLSVLADTPVWLRSGLASVSASDALRAPSSGAWSLADIVGHLRATDAILAPRVFHVLVRNQPPLIGFDERAWAALTATAQLSLAAQVDIFAGLRAELVGVLRALDASVWTRGGVHETRGPMSLLQIVVDIADHESEHHVQWDAALVALSHPPSAKPGHSRRPRNSHRPRSGS